MYAAQFQIFPESYQPDLTPEAALLPAQRGETYRTPPALVLGPLRLEPLVMLATVVAVHAPCIALAKQVVWVKAREGRAL